MKLRNKKTGEIADLAKGGLLKSDNDNHIIVYPEGTLKYYAYESLAELNREWYDYKQQEPLIKDEKVRKAVRAWAEANGIDVLSYYKSSHYWYLRASNNHDQSIDFWLSYDREPELIENKCYNITELCEEEGE